MNGILIGRPRTPFWNVTPPGGLVRNQLGYFCAPNAADASYAPAHRIEDFIAYGFLMSWLSPGDFALWWRLEREDIQWLREYFLRSLETVLLSIYRGSVEMPDDGKPYTDFDGGDYDSLNVGHNDEGEDEEVSLQWFPAQIGADGILAMDLVCSVTASADSNATGGNPVTIWLGKDAYENRARVRAAIAWARRVNNLDKAGPEPREWRKLKVPIASVPANVSSCGEFTRWAESAWPD
jgi:hypothetical protein